MKNNFKGKPEFFHSEGLGWFCYFVWWVLGLTLELYTCWVGAPPLTSIQPLSFIGQTFLKKKFKTHQPILKSQRQLCEYWVWYIYLTFWRCWECAKSKADDCFIRHRTSLSSWVTTGHWWVSMGARSIPQMPETHTHSNIVLLVKFRRLGKSNYQSSIKT